MAGRSLCFRCDVAAGETRSAGSETHPCFQRPVEVPCKILEAGTYVLSRVDTEGDWYMVQVTNDKNAFSSRNPLFEGRFPPMEILRFM